MVLRGGGPTPHHAFRNLAVEAYALSRRDPGGALERAIGGEVRTRLFRVDAGGPAGDLRALIPEALWVAEARWVVAA
jgi:hypothetical protein